MSQRWRMQGRAASSQEVDPMIKRLIVLVALGAALVACTPAGGSSPGTESVAPVESMPVESMPVASPSS
jgi:hypothetical protein